MYIYILTNTGRTVLYIGVTNDLPRRLYEHSTARGDKSKFTGRYQTDLLMFFEQFPDASQAIAREKELKGWSRAKKDALITAFNPEWKPIDLETWAGQGNEAVKMLRCALHDVHILPFSRLPPPAQFPVSVVTCRSLCFLPCLRPLPKPLPSCASAIRSF